MAMWAIYNSYTNLSTGQTERNFLKMLDDANRPPGEDMLAYFGLTERDNVQISSHQDGVIEAKIQYSQRQQQGWVRDNEADHDYIVTFRAERQP